MKTNTVSKCNNTTTGKRLPMPLTAAEDAALVKLATKEKRSKAAMAKIIYHMGLKAYAAQRKGA